MLTWRVLEDAVAWSVWVQVLEATVAQLGDGWGRIQEKIKDLSYSAGAWLRHICAWLGSIISRVRLPITSSIILHHPPTVTQSMSRENMASFHILCCLCFCVDHFMINIWDSNILDRVSFLPKVLLNASSSHSTKTKPRLELWDLKKNWLFYKNLTKASSRIQLIVFSIMKLSFNNKSAASTAFFGLCLSYHVDFTVSDHQKVEWSILKTTLPKPLSDHTASLGKGDGKVYIAGGCGKFF